MRDRLGGRGETEEGREFLTAFNGMTAAGGIYIQKLQIRGGHI